jgi:hypothetical protein
MSRNVAAPGDALLDKSLNAKRESKSIEFKQQFDKESSQDWCELLKDIIAIANSGGGVILIGVDNRGSPINADVSSIIDLDPADLGDKIFSYTSTNSAQVRILEASKGAAAIAVIRVGAADTPIVFSRAGTYAIAGGKQAAAFGKGSVYFRHHAKSEPATTDDLRLAFEKLLRQVRKEWMAGLRRVVQAPSGSIVKILPPEVRGSDQASATPIRIVDDPSAVGYRVIDPDKTHPFRLKEVIEALRKKLPSGTQFNSFDLQCIKAAHKIDKRREFFHRPLYASPQYSEQFVDWLAQQYGKDAEFFNKARTAYKKTET